ncbi:MAG: hypothetical protein ACRDQ4_17990 [Pseudonocardiaceae bacterium]
MYESAPRDKRAPRREAVARLVLATALVHLGTPDEAVTLDNQALASAHGAAWVMARARNLDRTLVRHYPRLACSREFHERYRHLAQRST